MNKLLSDIVTVENNQALTTSLNIATGTGNQHKNVLELISRHKRSLEEFGGVAFQTRPLQQKAVCKLDELLC